MFTIKLNEFARCFRFEKLSLLIIFCLALTVRLYLLFTYPHVVFLHEADAMGYFSIARSIVETGGPGETATHFPPFYPFVIALVSFFANDIELAGRLASCIMGALLVFPVYLAGRELRDSRTGLYAATLTAFFGAFVDYSLQPLSQATYLTILMFAVYFGMLLLRSYSLPTAALFGLTAGAAYLTRPEGIMVFAFIFFILIVVTICSGGMGLKMKLIMVSSPLIAFIVMALPYVVYLHRQIGVWTISGKSGITIIGVDASARLLQDGRTVGESLGAKKIGIMDLFSNLTDLANNYVGNLAKFSKIVPEHFPILVLLVALLGLGLSLRSALKKDDGSRLLHAAQLTVFLSGVAAVVPVFAFSNLSIAVSYILPIFPLVMICFCAGAISIEQMLLKLLGRAGLAAGDRLRNWTPVTAAVVVILCYLSFVPFWSQLASEDFREFAASQEFFLKDTGLWLKNNTPENSVVMSRWSNMAFYADRKWSYLADGKVREVIDYAKKHGVGYIVIDTSAVPRRRPELAPLLNPSTSHDGLRPVYAQGEHGIGVIIYQVL